MTTPIIPQNEDKDTPWYKRGVFPIIGEWYNDLMAAIVSGYWHVVVFWFGPQQKQEAKGNDGLHLAVTILSVFVSLFLLGISFYGSFTAATDYAIKNGIAESVALWIPVSVDGFIFLAVLVRFGASLIGAKAGTARLLILVFTAVSVVFNVAHITKSEDFIWQHYLLGAIFPVVVFLASEVTSHQISAYIKRKDALKTNQALADEVAAKQQEKSLLAQEIEHKRRAMLTEAQASVTAEIAALNEQREAKQAEVRKIETRLKSLSQKAETTYTDDYLTALVLFARNPSVTGNEIGQAIDKSTTRGNEIKREIKLKFNGVLTNGK